MASEQLSQAIAAVRAGELASGKQTLTALVQSEPNNDQAWMWLAVCLEDPVQKKYCLNRALAINPDNDSADRLLMEMEAQPAQAQVAEEPQQAPATSPFYGEPEAEPAGAAAEEPQAFDTSAFFAESEEQPAETAEAQPQSLSPWEEMPVQEEPAVKQAEATPPASAASAASTQPPAGETMITALAPEEPLAQEAEVKEPKKARKKKGSNTCLVWLVVILFVVLCIVAGFLVWYVLKINSMI